jgi:transposase InsO family protein
VSTIWRILSRRGFVHPQPQKRPRSSWRTFCADQPNERWQADITHWRLADGTDISILNILDDHSRLCLASHARRVMLVVTEMIAHLGLQCGLQHSLGQLAEQPIRATSSMPFS